MTPGASPAPRRVRDRRGGRLHGDPPPRQQRGLETCHRRQLLSRCGRDHRALLFSAGAPLPHVETAVIAARLPIVLLLWVLGPSLASAQPALSASAPTPVSVPRVGVGGGFAAARRACPTCDEPTPTRHTGGVLVNVGYVIDRRTRVAAEVVWIPVATVSGRRSTTHLDAVALFRPSCCAQSVACRCHCSAHSTPPH